jgi:hypothetical protein
VPNSARRRRGVEPGVRHLVWALRRGQAGSPPACVAAVTRRCRDPRRDAGVGHRRWTALACQPPRRCECVPVVARQG